jgi:hypothetical protein
MTTLHRWRFYANLIYSHAIVRRRHLSRLSSPLVTLWRVLVGVGDDVMMLLFCACVHNAPLSLTSIGRINVIRLCAYVHNAPLTASGKRDTKGLASGLTLRQSVDEATHQCRDANCIIYRRVSVTYPTGMILQV